MGLMDMLGFGSRTGEKALAKNIAKLINQNVQHEDRLRAAEILAEMDSAEATRGLLRRYDMTLDKGYMDQDEKVYIRDLVVEKGETAIEPIQQYLMTSDNINWPERILSTILDDEERVVSILLEVIEAHRDSGDMKGPKRAKLLNLLMQYQDPRIATQVASFLSDFDESVRYTAVEVLDTQGEDSVAEVLVKVMTGEEEDSVRVRSRILEVFLRHEWSVAPWRTEVEAWLPEDKMIRGDVIVER